MAQDYNSTLNLPQTEFSMRGNLTQKEPAMIEHWENDGTYYAMVKKNEGKNSETLKRIRRSFDLCKKTDVKPLVAFCQGDLSRSSLRRLES